MKFTLYTESDKSLKMVYHHSINKKVEINVGDLFVSIINHDFSILYKRIENTNTKWICSKSSDTNKLIQLYKELCIQELPYPISIFFYYSTCDLINPIYNNLNMIIDSSKIQFELIKFRKKIYESIVSGSGHDFETSEWTTKVEFISGTFYEYIDISFIGQLAEFCLYQVFKNEIQINKCVNCGRYFVPLAKSSEIYCSNVFKNNRTCKQIGYERKINSNEYMKAYRKAYKTKNAFKQRNLANNPSAEKDFKKWVYVAKLKLNDAQEGKLSLNEFIEWLSN